MSQPQPISDFINLGASFQVLLSPSVIHGQTYVNEVSHFITLANSCNLNATRAAASALQGIRLYYDNRGFITQVAVHQLDLTMQAVQQVLMHEAVQRQVIALDTGAVSGRLRTLPSDVSLTATQELLLTETMRCLEVGAFRSASVMGWNLTYDYIRQWVFDNRLTEFNTALTTRFSSDHPTPITRYDEFFTRRRLGEHRFLDICADALSGPIIGGALFNDLTQYLRLRNNYAHSNFVTPTSYTCNAYIEHLITIITSSPFN
jgi:hypothetical protein